MHVVFCEPHLPDPYGVINLMQVELPQAIDEKVACERARKFYFSLVHLLSHVLNNLRLVHLQEEITQQDLLNVLLELAMYTRNTVQ